MKKLFRFYWDCGRSGDIESVFVADQAEVDEIIGKYIYFGEVLGKHSEVRGTIEENDITVLTDDQDFIEKAEKYGISSCGPNPLEYYEMSQE